MDASTRILRALVVGQWLAGLGAIAVDFWLQSCLPEPLRSYEPGWDGSWAGMLGLAAALVGMGLALAGSVGIVALWRPARPIFVAGTLLGLASMPALGHAIVAAWTAPLLELSTLLCGATLGLLYLSPAARHFGRAPAQVAGTASPRDRLSSGAVLVGGAALGFLAGIGAVAVGLAGFASFADRAADVARADGQAYGTSRTDAECFDEARRYEPESAFGSPSQFLEGCLDAATATGAFCDGVPTYGARGSHAWQVARCEGDSDFDACGFLAESVQEHCHPDAGPL